MHYVNDNPHNYCVLQAAVAQEVVQVAERSVARFACQSVHGQDTEPTNAPKGCAVCVCV